MDWCWPAPDGQAAEIAAGFPDLALRTEPAHQEAFVRQETPRTVRTVLDNTAGYAVSTSRT